MRRIWIRQGITFAVILLILVVSGIWIARVLRGDPGQYKKPAIYLYCTKCLSVYEPLERLGGEHPRKCDKCGEKAAWYAMQCNDCGEIFPFAPELGIQGEIINKVPLCPRCRSGNSSMYGPLNNKTGR